MGDNVDEPRKDGQKALMDSVKDGRSQDPVTSQEVLNAEQTIDDPLFEVSEGLFRNKEMLRVGWVPDGARIVGRDEYISRISSLLNDAVLGKSPEHIAITGKTGTGKSLVSRYVANRAENAAIEGVRLGVVYIDCSEASTVTQVLSTIGQKLNKDALYDEEEEYIHMPDAGLSKQKFYERFWDILDHYDSAIFILDEVDLLNDELVLMNLAKAVEKQATVCNIGIVAISNLIGFFEDLQPRTKSVFQPEKMVFDPYDSNDLRKILDARKDAFYDGVLDEKAVINLVAAMSAQDHGDARKAMRLFRSAGEVAEKEEAEIVREKHVRYAQRKLEKEQFNEFINGTTTQMKAVCLAISAHDKWDGTEYVSTSRLFETYKRIASAVDMGPVTIRRFRDIIDSVSLHQIVESRSRNVGKAGGRKNEHMLLHNPDVIKEVVMTESKYDGISEAELKGFVNASR